MAFRFVHSADVHLDSPFRSLALRDPNLAEMIGNATRRAFVKIVDLCLDEQVDALLLAGDLYDGDQTSMKTAKFFALQMHRLHEAGVRVFVVRGNHDAESKITKELTLPNSLKLFTGRADYVEIAPAAGGMPLAIHGMSFADPKMPTSLVPKFKPPVEGSVNIGIMHTSLTGADNHNTYAPCTVADLNATGFKYWALGHVHKRSVYDGLCKVVMPGNPQGRDINEAGAKTATLVTIGDDGSIELEERLTSIAEFARISVSAQDCDDWSAVAAAIRAGIEKAREGARSEHLVGRIIVSGVTPTAWELRHDARRLKVEADVVAELAGKTWIEKVEIDCKMPDTAAAAESGDALAEIMVEIEGGVLSSDAFIYETEEIAKELWDVLPRECQVALGGADEAKFKAEIRQLAREGVDEVMARLRMTDGLEIF